MELLYFIGKLVDSLSIFERVNKKFVYSIFVYSIFPFFFYFSQNAEIMKLIN